MRAVQCATKGHVHNLWKVCTWAAPCNSLLQDECSVVGGETADLHSGGRSHTQTKHIGEK